MVGRRQALGPGRGPPMTARARRPVRFAGRRALGRRRIGELARSIAAARGRSVALVYHRVDEDDRSSVIVPSVPAEVFRRQVATLAEVGDIVDIEELLDARGARRPRFALTFDDDYRTHAETALPVLRSSGVVGAFFLSGRSMHGLGPYWFERLDALLSRVRVDEAARRIGAEARDARALAIECENDRGLQRRLEELETGAVAEHLGADDIRALAGAGMTVGFHTLHHRVLPNETDPELCEALSSGRTRLQRAVGVPLRHFAYPHGRVDARVASSVAAAGFVSGWSGRPRAIHRRSDRYRLGRWEPGSLGVDDLIVSLAIRLTVDR
jgi:peptidoglycan/xylan/chitin deacetylase (PgdA/CDA1 family)